MSYEYDTGSTRLIIEQDKTMDGVTPLALIQAEHLTNPSITVHVKTEDAPAVALAILDAAGIRPDALSGNREQRAAAYLKAWSVEHARRVEREAEDAKAKAYRYAIFPAAVPWEHLDEDAREAHRVKYRTARDYFAKENQS